MTLENLIIYLIFGTIGFFVIRHMYRDGDFNCIRSATFLTESIKVDYKAYRKQKFEMAIDYLDRFQRGTEFRRKWLDTRLKQIKGLVK